MKLFLILLISFSAQANETIYVDGNLRVTFRTGPGTDNKVIAMVESGEKLKLVESSGDWTKATLSDGKEGWLLTRFTTKEVPSTIKLEWLGKKYKKLQEKNESLKTSLNELTSTNKTLNTELDSVKVQLSATQKELEEIKLGAANYLSLKKDLNKKEKKLEKTTEKVSSLENKMNKYYLKWFLSGAGVLLLGLLIGSLSRRKKYSPSIQL